MRSLRRTLAVRFSVTVFFALLLIALWAYLGAQRILRAELDRGLAAACELEGAVLAAGLELPTHPGPQDLERFVATVNRFVAIRNADGSIRQTNTPLAQDLPADPVSVAQAGGGARSWKSERWKGQRIRSVYGPVPGSTDGRVIQVSASLIPLRAANREILFLMLGTVLLGTVATSLGAAWLAGSAVQPVMDITAQAEEIGTGRLGHRITAHWDVAEFQGLVRVLNGMLKRLDSMLESQRRMVADAGHDLRTPLTAMRGEIEVALRGSRSPDEYRQVLHSVMEEVDRLGSISESLVLLARVEGGTLVPSPVPCDLIDLLEGAVRRAQARGGDRTFGLTSPVAIPQVEVDQRMLTIVFDHLLDNCLQHTPPGTAVELSITRDGRWARVDVDDDGPGVPTEGLERLFDRFYRDDTARTRTAGAGLGLSIASAIVGTHGGRIEAARSRLGGLRVTIRLPLLRQS